MTPDNISYISLTVANTNTDGLRVLAFDGIEALNSEYIFEITLVNTHSKYDITQLLNKAAYLSFNPNNTDGIHGQIQLVRRGTVGKDYSLFKVILAPRFYYFHHETNQRAFVNKTVPEIINNLLTEKNYQQGIDFEFKLKDQNLYVPRKLCCQFNETTADFIHRLCEEEGLNTHYQFSKNNHKLIISDDNSFFETLTNAFNYYSDETFSTKKPNFKQFEVNLSNHFTSYGNYKFATPKNERNEEQKQSDKKQNNRYTIIETERLKANQIQAEANSNITALHSGHIFTLTNYPIISIPEVGDGWLITQLYHQVRHPQEIKKLGGEVTTIMQEPTLLFKYYKFPISELLQFPFDSFKQGYRNCMLATPQKKTYRSQKIHTKPKILGSQIATVTGTAKNKVYSDGHGQIKIIFNWDKINQKNENSSHWVKLSSNCTNDYIINTPLVGMEVKVEFLEGDIDKPIVTGVLFNGANTSSLPQLTTSRTKSIFKTIARKATSLATKKETGEKSSK